MVAVEIFQSRKPWVGSLQFDCSLSEDHGVELELTDRPIEAGGVVSDHAVKLPRSITLTVGVSNQPDELLSVPSPTRHLRMWRSIRDMWNRLEIVDVVTTLEVYPLMMIRRASLQRTSATTGALNIVINLRRIEWSLVDGATAIADAAHDIALGAADLGAQGAAVAAAAELTAIITLVTLAPANNATPGLLP
jgi:hypothetical protein